MTRGGRKLLAGIFRVDLGGLIQLKDVGEADAQVLTQWIRVSAQNLDLLLAWGVLWLVLHFSMIGVGAVLLGPHHGMPRSVLIPIEVIPGYFVALFAIRMTASLRMVYKLIDAVGGARGASAPPPAWTQRRGLMLALMTPSDWDFVPAVAIVGGLELVIK